MQASLEEHTLAARQDLADLTRASFLSKWHTIYVQLRSGSEESGSYPRLGGGHPGILSREELRRGEWCGNA